MAARSRIKEAFEVSLSASMRSCSLTVTAAAAAVVADSATRKQIRGGIRSCFQSHRRMLCWPYLFPRSGL